MTPEHGFRAEAANDNKDMKTPENSDFDCKKTDVLQGSMGKLSTVMYQGEVLVDSPLVVQACIETKKDVAGILGEPANDNKKALKTELKQAA